MRQRRIHKAQALWPCCRNCMPSCSCTLRCHHNSPMESDPIQEALGASSRHFEKLQIRLGSGGLGTSCFGSCWEHCLGRQETQSLQHSPTAFCTATPAHRRALFLMCLPSVRSKSNCCHFPDVEKRTVQRSRGSLEARKTNRKFQAGRCPRLNQTCCRSRCTMD